MLQGHPGQGRGKMPAAPKRAKGQRGPVGRSDAHSLPERLAATGGNVLRFTGRADTPFPDNLHPDGTTAVPGPDPRCPGPETPPSGQSLRLGYALTAGMAGVALRNGSGP